MSASPASAVLTYNAKVWLAGFAAALFVPLSIAALAVDVLMRRDLADGLSGRVLRASAEFEAAIDVHGNLTDIRIRESADDPPHASLATA